MTVISPPVPVNVNQIPLLPILQPLPSWSPKDPTEVAFMVSPQAIGVALAQSSFSGAG